MIHLLLAAAASAAPASPDSPSGILDFLSKGGVLGLLILILVGGFRRWWVFGWQYQAMCDDRDEWRALAATGTKVAERATDVVEAQRQQRGRKA